MSLSIDFKEMVVLDDFKRYRKQNHQVSIASPHSAHKKHEMDQAFNIHYICSIKHDILNGCMRDFNVTFAQASA